MTPVPKIAPVRVANITSPDPIYSAHQIKAGPTNAKTARPLGGCLIVSLVVTFVLSFTGSGVKISSHAKSQRGKGGKIDGKESETTN